MSVFGFSSTLPIGVLVRVQPQLLSPSLLAKAFKLSNNWKIMRLVILKFSNKISSYSIFFDFVTIQVDYLIMLK